MNKIFNVKFGFTGSHDFEIEAECSEEAEAIAETKLDEILFDPLANIDNLVINEIKTEELEDYRDEIQGNNSKYL